MRILMALPFFPYPPDSGNVIRCLELIKRIGADDELDVLALDTVGSGADAVARVASFCRTVYPVPRRRRPKIAQVPALVGKILRGIPLDTKYADSRELGARLTRLTRENAYHIVHFEKSMMAVHVDRLAPGHGARTVLSLQDVGFSQLYRIYTRERRLFRKAWLLLNWLPMMTWEPRVARRFDKTLAVSALDRMLLQALDPQLDVDVIPNGVDTRRCRPFPLEQRAREILIVGTLDYPPNIDGVVGFCRDIFPLIRSRIPDCALSVVGKNPTTAVRRLGEQPGITVHPNVPDVQPFYQRALLSAVPLKAGGGTRLKILESLAFGTPVVSTRIGCEGLNLEAGRAILVADSPAAFADAVCALAESPARWRDLSEAGRRAVEEEYDWDRIAARLREVYARLAARPQAKGPAY